MFSETVNCGDLGSAEVLVEVFVDVFAGFLVDVLNKKGASVLDVTALEPLGFFCLCM